MFWISRAHVAHAGYKDAWYEGATFDFRDADTGSPSSTVIKLPNEGGKTTLLSLLLSVFEPRKDQFLQVRKLPNASFFEYFGEDAPGWIAFEWQPFEGGADSTLVTAQIVCIGRDRSGAMEDTRFFVVFRARPGFGFEQLPCNGLGDRPLASVGEVRRWLEECGRNHPGFRWTGGQAEWRAMLADEGIDAELIGRQGDFSLSEGGMDKFVRDIRSEPDFVRIFLGMTMEQTGAERQRHHLVSALEMLRERPRVEAQARLLAGLATHTEAFSAQAVRLLELGEHSATAATTAARLHRAAEAAAIRLRAGVPDIRAKAAGHRQQAAADAATGLACAAEAEAWIAHALGAEWGAATEAREAAVREVEAAGQALLTANAAQALGEQRLLEAAITALEAGVERRGRGLAPARKAVRAAAGALAASLADQMQGLVAEEQAMRTDLAMTEQEMRRLRQELEACGRRRGEAGATLARNEGLLQAANGSLASLRRAGMVQATEAPDAALARLQLQQGKARQALTAAETRHAALEEEYAASTRHRSSINASCGSLQNSLRELTRRLAEGEALRRKLAGNAAIAQVFEGEVELDAPDLVPRIAARVAALEAQAGELARSLDELHRDARAIEASGVAVDGEVQRVADLLRAEGIHDAKPWTRHVADTLPLAAEARAAALANPALHRAVVVYTKAHLQRAMAVLAGVEVRRPVPVVLLAAAATTPGDAVMPRGDEGWNAGAAEDYLAGLQQRLREHTERRDGYDALRRALLATTVDVAAWSAQFSGGTLDALAAQLRDTEAELVGLRREGELATAAKARLGEVVVEAKAEVRGANEALVRLEGGIGAVQRYLDQYAGPQEAAVLAACAEARAMLAAIEAEMTEHRAESEALGRQRDLLHGKLAQGAHDQAGNRALAAGLPEHDAGVAYQGSLPELQARLRQCLDILQRVESDQLGTLAAELDIKRELLKAAQTRYAAQFGKASRAAVEAMLAACIDLEEARVQATERQGVAQQAMGAASATLAQARHDLDAHAARRAHQAPLPPGAAAVAPVAAREQAAALVGQATALAETAQQSTMAAAAAERQATEMEGHVRRVVGFAGRLAEAAAAACITPGEPHEIADIEEFDAAVTAAVAAFAEAQRQYGQQERRAEAAFQAMRECAIDRHFVEYEEVLSHRFKAMVFGAGLQGHGQLGEALCQRLQVVEAELADMEPALVNCTASLVEFHAQVSGLLKRAAEDIRLPDHVPNIGGKTVIRMRRAPWKASDEDRQARLRAYVLNLAASGTCPATAADLAAELVSHCSEGSLGIELLKVTDIGENVYLGVGALNASGAQGMTTSMLIFLVAGAIRLEERLGRRRVRGQVLLLDNPFAVANKESIVRLQMEMAERLGVQLIFLTGTDDANTLGVFRHFVCIHRLGRTGRTRRMVLSTARQSVAEAA